MQSIPRHTIIIKAISQLGLPAVFRMGIHRLAYTTGYYKFKTRKPPELPQEQLDRVQIPGILNIPPAEYFTLDSRCIPLAEEICSGYFHPFSGEVEPLRFDVPEKDLHWTQIKDYDPNNDLKLLWEPARFQLGFFACSRLCLVKGLQVY